MPNPSGERRWIDAILRKHVFWAQRDRLFEISPSPALTVLRSHARKRRAYGLAIKSTAHVVYYVPTTCVLGLVLVTSHMEN